ncbi:MAG: phosphotransacetylase family protein [Anaerolineales bacterium]|nr:phosphotransacetylase family protein [Anaerolineales bacterium]HEY62038.1 phosphotransacetylase family protein [Anaerolineae bacterium]
MNSIYITSVERYSGKTAVSLSLGIQFQKDGKKVGYLKPLSIQPWRVRGKMADEDASFAIDALGLEMEPWELSPFVVTEELLKKTLSGKGEDDLVDRVKRACIDAGKGKDVLLLEGGGSLREGYLVGLPTPVVAKLMNSYVLIVIKYRDKIRLMDDILSAYTRLGDDIVGVIINRVPDDAKGFVEKYAEPYLEQMGLPVFGVMPEVRSLAALTVGELIEVLGAEVLTNENYPEKFVETLTIGAMTTEAALHRFRKQRYKAVITGGDRTDIQLAALETSTSCLVLTGHLHPSPLIIKQAEDLKVPILLVRDNTMETVENIERVFGKTRLGQSSKLKKFHSMLMEYVDIERLYSLIGF